MYLDKIVIGSKVAPRKGLLVGFGVVTGIFQYSQPDRRVYEVMTDFGNFIKFTQDEFCDIYTNEIYYEWCPFEDKLEEYCAVDNLEERINDQILNLQSALEDLKERSTI